MWTELMVWLLAGSWILFVIVLEGRNWASLKAQRKSRDEGWNSAVSHMRRWAIQSGVAEYVVDDPMNGGTEFQWKTPDDFEPEDDDDMDDELNGEF